MRCFPTTNTQKLFLDPSDGRENSGFQGVGDAKKSGYKAKRKRSLERTKRSGDVEKNIYQLYIH
jgi:hypothetical protein